MRSRQDKLRRFFHTGYQAKSWSRERTVIARVQASAKGFDIRFIVTNRPGRVKTLCDKVYCARGRMENMIKEHKLYTRSDRTSCHRWESNQFRPFLHTRAYWLLHQLRRAAALAMARGDVRDAAPRLPQDRRRARIEELKSRLRVALPSAYPYRKAMISMAGCIAAQGP